jgi:hypothetical protein
MKLTASQLKKIIKEETARVVAENNKYPPRFIVGCEASAHAIEKTLVEYFGDWGGKSPSDFYLEALALCEEENPELDGVYVDSQRSQEPRWEFAVMRVLKEMLGPKLAAIIKLDILSSKADEYMRDERDVAELMKQRKF